MLMTVLKGIVDTFYSVQCNYHQLHSMWFTSMNFMDNHILICYSEQGYQCLIFRKKNHSVMELITGSSTICMLSFHLASSSSHHLIVLLLFGRLIDFISQTGPIVAESSQACLAQNLGSDQVETRLLIDDNAPLTTCPLSGKYQLEQEGVTCPIYMEMACDNPSLISISSCQFGK